MDNFYKDMVTFFILEAILLGALILYSFYKGGWTIEGFMKNWENAEGKKTPLWKGIGVILVVPLVFGFLLHSCNANANEIKYFDNAKVFVGVDNTSSVSPFCQSLGINDRLTSNLGFVQSLASKGNFNVGAKYTHHSCALNPDKNAYDSIGIVIEWKLY